MRHKKTLLLRSSKPETGVFSYANSVETKLACIEMRKAGKSNKVMMETLGMKNGCQVQTWLRWLENMTCVISSQPSEWGCHDTLVLP